nr:alpha/beta hydrolase [Pigmentiphaga litoralis]
MVPRIQRVVRIRRRSVTRRGAIFVAIDYRLSGIEKFPAALDDCLAAVAWTKQNIAHYGGDPNQIFIGGHSAGGNLAALVTLRSDRHVFFGLEPGDIKACFPFSGIYDLRHSSRYAENPSIGSIDAWLTSQDDAHAASPICHTKNNVTPFFVSWSQYDAPLMLAQALPFVAALVETGTSVKSHVFPAFDHFHIHLDQIRDANYFNDVLLRTMFPT